MPRVNKNYTFDLLTSGNGPEQNPTPKSSSELVLQNLQNTKHTQNYTCYNVKTALNFSLQIQGQKILYVIYSGSNGRFILFRLMDEPRMRFACRQCSTFS